MQPNTSSQNQNNQMSKLYTTAETAAILNISLRTVQSWIRNGTLPHIRLGEAGRLVRIRAEDLEALIQRHYQS